jgi:hypothetical protein
MRDLMSDATPGSLEFSTCWQHRGVPVDEPEPPSHGAGAATTAVATKARVKSWENMAVVVGRGVRVLMRAREGAGC